MDSQKVIDLIKKSNTIAIVCHTRPDADTLGSALSLTLALKQLGKEVTVLCDTTPIAKRFMYLKGCCDIISHTNAIFDVTIAIDCGELYRMGLLAEWYIRQKNTINIDHHVLTNNRYGKLNIVENQSSTCEIIYDLIKRMGVEITIDMATCMLAGILTDTNRFCNSNTSSKTFVHASELIEYGVDINELGFVMIRELSLPRARLTGLAMSRIKTYQKGKIAFTYITLDDLEQFGCSITDGEGLVERAVCIEGCEVGICICQSEKYQYKVSMRGRHNANVCAVCQQFGGGGHRVASGCTIKGDLYDIKEKILKAVCDEMNYPMFEME